MMSGACDSKRASLNVAMIAAENIDNVVTAARQYGSRVDLGPDDSDRVSSSCRPSTTRVRPAGVHVLFVVIVVAAAA